MKTELRKLCEDFTVSYEAGQELYSELLNLYSVSIRTCSDAFTTIIKWNEHDKNGTDNRAPHKDECIDVICRATLNTLKQVKNITYEPLLAPVICDCCNKDITNDSQICMKCANEL